MTHQHRRNLTEILELPGLARLRKHFSLRLAELAFHPLDASKSGGNPRGEELLVRPRPRCNLNGAKAVAKSRLPTMPIRIGVEVAHEDVGACGRHTPHLGDHALQVENVTDRKRANYQVEGEIRKGNL